MALLHKRRGSFAEGTGQFEEPYGVATISRLPEIIVSFAEYGLFYRDLLQKRPIILRSLLIEANPY